ncbi:OmpA family protein [Nevskia soli]|uniref:OmpA family protein n=1 Tax=Nevskia soli TaxID=418856 RepID=UPI00068DB2ED|nr:OmpA family protein [Nevskia soli]
MRRTLQYRLLLAALITLLSTAVRAQDEEPVLDTRIYVAPMASMAISRHDRSDTDAIGGGLAIGKTIMPHLTLELRGDYLRYHGESETVSGTGLLCGLLSSCPDQNVRSPSTHVYGGGLGVNGYVLSTNSGVYVHGDAEAGSRFVYNAGIGLDYPLWDHALYIRGELLYHHEADFTPEPLFHLGVRIPFGQTQKPAEPLPEAPVEVVPVESPPPPADAAPATEAPPPAATTCQPPSPGQPISLEGCKTGDTLVLHGVNFEFNKSVLTLNAKTLLDQVADALLQRTDIKVEIDGHTDGVGGVAYNQRLSEERAKSVQKYIEGRGIAADRLTAKGFGKSMPIADNNTDEGREQNRRVELRVTDSGAAAAQAPAAPTDAVAATSLVPTDSGAKDQPGTLAPAVGAPDSGAAPGDGGSASETGTAPVAPGGDTPVSPAENSEPK